MCPNVDDQWRFEATTGTPQAARMWTRVYSSANTRDVTAANNYILPGPILRVKPGDTLSVTIHNNLGANADVSATCTNDLNTIHNPNTTNIHTHGLHISSVEPADSVWVQIAPGTTYTHSYTIPSDHAGGTHWYHAHQHGSTALQAGGGAAGLLIVDDTACDVPSWVSSMPEHLLMMTYVSPSELNTMGVTACDNLLQNSFTTSNDMILVNGISEPTVSIDANVPARLRLAFASVFQTMQLDFATGSSCTWTLLAKDGIYIKDAPRAATTLYLAPGNRADVAVTCTTAGSFNVVMSNFANAVVFTLNVATGTATSVPAMDAFQARYPNYLADLQNVASPTTFALSFAGGGGGGPGRRRMMQHFRRNLLQGKGTGMAGPGNAAGGGGGGCTVNGNSYTGHTAADRTTEVIAGSVNEWTVTGTGGHPFHLHINPYQIKTINADATNWYKVGDWHDVFYEFNNVGNPTVRFAANDFTGDMVLHCHFLEHEDLGCMGFAQITGTEGAVSGLTGTALITDATVDTSTCTCTGAAGSRSCTQAAATTTAVNCASTWSDWGACDATSSTQTRTITITTPASGGGTACPASPESRACTPDVDCVSSWSAWGTCTASSQSRTLTITTAASGSGTACPTVTTQTQTCAAGVVNCDYTWSAWGACTGATTVGTQTRTANILTAASGGGTACPTDTTQTQTCTPPVVNCAYAWSIFSACDATSLTRSRTITITTAASGNGTACPTSPQTQACTPEVVNCAYTWSAWGTCSLTSSSQTRTITVTTAALNGGTGCPASPETQTCTPTACSSYTCSGTLEARASSASIACGTTGCDDATCCAASALSAGATVRPGVVSSLALLVVASLFLSTPAVQQ